MNKPYYSNSRLIKNIIDKKFKIKRYNLLLSISDEKDYSIAFMIHKNIMLNWNSFIDNLKTLFYALIIAILIRSLFIQPFYIPSSSMEPNLLVGIGFLLRNIHMVIVNIHFHLALQF